MTRTDDEKRRLLAELSTAIAAGQEALDAFDEAAAIRLGLNRTDLRCLSILDRAGPLTPSVLAERAGLSRPATTTAIDRLAAAGYVRRLHDSIDRRRVFVEVTARARRAGAAIWGPLTTEGLATASGYDAEQLRLILDFVRASRELHETHAARVRQAPSSRRAGRAAKPPDAAR
jgi:DNA-binding MarR family transcriptional regulator